MQELGIDVLLSFNVDHEPLAGVKEQGVFVLLMWKRAHDDD